MTKTVFTTDMLIHVWANQSQTEGRRQTGTLSFHGRMLTHYHGVCAVHMGEYVLLDYAQCRHTGWNSGNLAWAIGRAISPRQYHAIPDLPGDAAHALNTLASKEASKANKSWACKVLKEHVARHISDYSDESACLVLRLAGVRTPASHMNRLRIAADKADKADKAKEAKREQQKRVAFAVRVAEYAPDSVALYAHKLTMDRHVRGEGLAAGYWGVERFLLDIARAHKAAKAAKREALATKVWQRLKAARARVAKTQDLQARFQQSKFWRGYLSDVREGFAHLQNGRTYESHKFRNFVVAAERLANYGRTPESAKPRLRELHAAWTQALDLQLAAEKKAAFEKQEADRIAWLSGAKVRAYGLHDSLGGPLLRAVEVKRDDSGNITGGNLETSQGATVPLPHAVKVFQFVKRCKESGTAWQRNGHTIRVGHFQVDEISPNGNFRAGCHSINWQEVERVAVALGVMDVAASDSALESTH